MIRANHYHKTSDCSKKTYSSYVYESFPPILCPRANHCYRSSLSCSFQKRDGSDSLLSLFKKEKSRANCSCRFLQKRDSEKLAPAAHDKRVTKVNHSFSQADRSFAHKKRAIRSKIPTLQKSYCLLVYLCTCFVCRSHSWSDHEPG